MAKNPILSAIQDVPFLKVLDESRQGKLAAIAQLVPYRRGEVIFSEWKLAQHLYVVVSGSVQLTSAKAAHREIGSLVEGDLFGWSAIVEPQRFSTATARADSAGKLLLFEREPLLALMEEDYELGFHLMKHIAHVLAERLAYVFVQFNMPDADQTEGLAS